MDHFFLIWRTHFGARVLVGCYADRKADDTHLSTPGYHGEQYNHMNTTVPQNRDM